MRQFIFLLLLTLLFTKGITQKLNEDSIKNVIASSAVDSVKVNAMQTYANYLIRHRRQDSTGLIILEESKKIAEKKQLFGSIAKYYLILGNYRQQQNNWAGSIDAFTQMKVVAESIPDKNARGNVLMRANNNLAGIHYYNGDFTGSLEYHLKALEQVENLPHDANSKATLYVNIASDYRQLKLADKGYEYVQKITPLLPDMKDALKISYYYELYQNQLLQNKAKEAAQSLQTIREALTTYDLNPGQQLDLTIQYHEQAGQYEMSSTHNYAAALSHFQQSLATAKQAGEDFSIVEAQYNVGWAYDSLKQYPEAITALTLAYDDAIKFSLSEFAFKSAGLLAGIYQKTKNDRQGFYYARMALQLKDSIVSAEKLQELNFLEGKYQSQKKEKEIADLTISNTEKELIVVKRNRLLLIGGISAASLLFILGLLYRSSKQKQLIAEKEQKVQQQQIQFLEKQQQVVSMQSMVNGQEAERTRIAKDLHDGLGGLFSTIKMQLSTLKHDEKQLEQNALFQKSYELVDTASVEVRRIAHNMMPEVLMKLGLLDAIKDMCSNINAGKLLQLSLQAYGMEKRLNSSTEIMLYRILQELLNNIIKHAQATEVIVQFNRDGNRLSVTVEDNGKGFNTEAADGQAHAGLETVQSRVNYLQGRLSIESQQGLGTTVMMDFLINDPD